MLLSATTAGICQLQALSPVGRCHSFDASGDGYGRGEGFAIALLRPSALVRAVLAAAGAAHEAVGAVSVHGTGTPLGDPIEVGALRQALAGPKVR
ncbi:hypothetical protein WJX81_004632 [Elliptochloris bilobata]|uniref:Beta-ketoacyl synthase C-terminal domain-containing protein n=1 Tax=Elliptochloris bilobata TaxID=381761 RepID=A0AAW1S746_9CHLO